MTLTELPWLFMGRRIRPYAFAVSLASASVAWILLTGRSSYTSLDASVAGELVGWAALVAAILLWVGFWKGSDLLMEHGLAITAGVFAARFIFIGLHDSWVIQPALLSFCWCVASAGAYLLERTSGARRVR